ncbi:MAG: hypothetical protein GF375_01640, partial [Candidatus Omnitrophica bacterium]|nr:hypothetical protein [Candidatus Omnitrophota bacterium]
MESPTKLHGVHVTSDPQPVLDVLAKGGDISKGRKEGLVGDLGSSGLYFSQAPQLWTGRAYGKWEFLKSLPQAKREALADKLMKELRKERDDRYITEWELETALRYIDHYVTHDYAGSIVMLAGQPYNIAFWKEEWLSPLGIEQGKPPVYVEVEAVGRFADLTGLAITPELIERLKKEGYDGAYHRGDMINLPQSVVWNTHAITKFGEMAFARNPSIWPLFATGLATGVASGSAFALTGYLLNKYVKNPEIKVSKGALGTPMIKWSGRTYLLSYRSWDGSYVFVDPETKQRIEFAPPEGRKWEVSPMSPGAPPEFSQIPRPGEWVYDPAARKVYQRPIENPDIVSPHPEEVEHLQGQVKELWKKACEYEGIPVDSKFVIFSKDNPYNEAYNRAMTQYMKVKKEFYKAVGKLFERKREERMDNPIDDYKGFRAWITPIPEEDSEGKWDYDVKVQRLSDGKTKTLKVSGGWQVAESYARKLMDELRDVENPCYADNPIQITLHRGSYPTLISSEAATLLRAGRRGGMKPSDYKTILLSEYENIGRGGGYASGDIWKRKDGMATLEETFNSEIGAFILRVAKPHADNKRQVNPDDYAGKYALVKDNKIIFEGTKNECLIFLH